MKKILTDLPTNLLKKMEARQHSGSLRILKAHRSEAIDFYSNDYLGIGRTQATYHTNEHDAAKGSRLISGQAQAFEAFETFVANWLEAEAALLFNSGYDANVGFFSCVPQRGDTVLYDEYSHASIRDGLRISFAKTYSFQHQNLNELEQRLARTTGIVYVAVESVYSMDGDRADLPAVISICEKYGARLVVDEAHATGVYGRTGGGLVASLGVSEAVFARIHTFGKAVGAHGAVVVGSKALKNYLINFARAFIYTTAFPVWFLEYFKDQIIACQQAGAAREALFANIHAFAALARNSKNWFSFESPVGYILIPTNQAVKQAEYFFTAKGFNVKAILSPTVPEGTERLRISLHSFNTADEINALGTYYLEYLSNQNV